MKLISLSIKSGVWIRMLEIKACSVLNGSMRSPKIRSLLFVNESRVLGKRNAENRHYGQTN